MIVKDSVYFCHLPLVFLKIIIDVESTIKKVRFAALLHPKNPRKIDQTLGVTWRFSKSTFSLIRLSDRGFMVHILLKVLGQPFMMAP